MNISLPSKHIENYEKQIITVAESTNQKYLYWRKNIKVVILDGL